MRIGFLRAAASALGRLRDGNRRFVANRTTATSLAHQARREALVAGQEPFAIIPGCSDSRVPAELVFDQGFGDLFVIRVAGNIVAPSQVASVARGGALRDPARRGDGALAVRRRDRDAGRGHGPDDQ